MLSIIIPAHNEETVIVRGLRAILTGAKPGELEVIVACNGCTDRTAEIARNFGPPVRVIELAQASKVAALNAADELATGFPRFYVDADVVLDLASIRAMAAVLDRGDALLAAPTLRMDLSQTSWPVRAYYRVWTSLPYNQVMVGTGAYGLSRAGRARFERFPDLIADDGFVRFSFSPAERVRVDSAFSWVDPPRSLAGLIRIKTRSRLGGYQLRQARTGSTHCTPSGVDLTRAANASSGPSIRARFLQESDRGCAMASEYSPQTTERKSLPDLVRTLLTSPGLWPALPCYAAICIVAHLGAASRLRTRRNTRWQRDDSRPAPTHQY